MSTYWIPGTKSDDRSSQERLAEKGNPNHNADGTFGSGGGGSGSGAGGDHAATGERLRVARNAAAGARADAEREHGNASGELHQAVTAQSRSSGHDKIESEILANNTATAREHYNSTGDRLSAAYVSHNAAVRAYEAHVAGAGKG